MMTNKGRIPNNLCYINYRLVYCISEYFRCYSLLMLQKSFFIISHILTISWNFQNTKRSYPFDRLTQTELNQI